VSMQVVCAIVRTYVRCLRCMASSVTGESIGLDGRLMTRFSSIVCRSWGPKVQTDCRNTWVAISMPYRGILQMPSCSKAFGVVGNAHQNKNAEMFAAMLKPLTQAYCSSCVSGLYCMALLHNVVGPICSSHWYADVMEPSVGLQHGRHHCT